MHQRSCFFLDQISKGTLLFFSCNLLFLLKSRGYTGNQPARLRLPKICAAIGWKEPSFDFEEQGPPHNKLFTCKVTVHLEGLVNTVMECFSDPKPKKKAAQDHAAQAALWCLERFGHAKWSSDVSLQAARLSALLLLCLTNLCFRCHMYMSRLT